MQVTHIKVAIVYTFVGGLLSFSLLSSPYILKYGMASIHEELLYDPDLHIDLFISVFHLLRVYFVWTCNGQDRLHKWCSLFNSVIETCFMLFTFLFLDSSCS